MWFEHRIHRPRCFTCHGSCGECGGERDTVVMPACGSETARSETSARHERQRPIQHARRPEALLRELNPLWRMPVARFGPRVLFESGLIRREMLRLHGPEPLAPWDEGDRLAQTQ